MDTIKTVTVHGREININLSKVFTSNEYHYALCHLDPQKTNGYRPFRTYPEVCKEMEKQCKRLKCLLIIDVDGKPLHYAHDNTLPIELQ